MSDEETYDLSNLTEPQRAIYEEFYGKDAMAKQYAEMLSGDAAKNIDPELLEALHLIRPQIFLHKIEQGERDAYTAVLEAGITTQEILRMVTQEDKSFEDAMRIAMLRAPRELDNRLDNFWGDVYDEPDPKTHKIRDDGVVQLNRNLFPGRENE